jgi:RNA polymerase sigma-70 factor (ECF subfamily)
MVRCSTVVGETPDPRYADELALVEACVRGDADALARFDREYLRELRDALRTIDSSPSFIDETIQLVRHRLLVADGDRAARLASYAGTGPLGGWLRVVAIRVALAQRQSAAREVPIANTLEAVAGVGPQHQLARAEHAALLRQALAGALASQPSRMRALLRYYYLDNVGVEDLGKIYRVHASTISRWLAATRATILADTRRRLAAALSLGEPEVDSMLDLSGSLELSLDRLLRSTGG